MRATIEYFRGRYNFLSNFHPAIVTLDGAEYSTVEHAYQAAKSLAPIDRFSIQRLPTPAEAKRAGRRLRARRDWGAVKLSVMKDLVMEKFTRHAHLRQLLLDTGDAALIEGNHHGDTFWGCVNGQGLNHLGHILEEVRDRLTRAAS